MADFRFWQNLADDFRALPEDGTFAYKVIEGMPGTIPPPGDHWYLVSDTRHAAQRFELFAGSGSV